MFQTNKKMEIIVLNCICVVVENISIKAEDDVVTSNAKARFKNHPINTVFGGLRQQKMMEHVAKHATGAVM